MIANSSIVSHPVKHSCLASLASFSVVRTTVKGIKKDSEEKHPPRDKSLEIPLFKALWGLFIYLRVTEELRSRRAPYAGTYQIIEFD